MSSLGRFIRAKQLPSIVNNTAFQGTSSKTYAVQDAHHRTLLHTVEAITTEDVPSVVQSASKALESWRETPVEQRQDIFWKAASLLDKYRGELVALEHAETTSTKMWADMDWGFARAQISETANVAPLALRGGSYISGSTRGPPHCFTAIWAVPVADRMCSLHGQSCQCPSEVSTV